MGTLDNLLTKMIPPKCPACKPVKEASDGKEEAQWQSEKVLTYVEDLLHRAGKEDLVVSREGTELLLKAQGKVFKLSVEKVL